LHYLQIGIQIILMFFVLVTLHEWGHFYFAKRAGILVREFAIGFGPKLFSFNSGETKYTLRLLPIGGFVRMAGEDPEIVDVSAGQTIAVRLADGQVTRLFLDKLELRTNTLQGVVEQIDLEHNLHVSLNVDGESIRYPVHPQALLVARGKETQIAPWNRQFGSKTVGQRALSIFAGPVMNFLLAFVLFILYMFVNGVPTQVKLNDVASGSAAQKAGLQKGDIILQIDGHEIGKDSSLLTSLIKESAGKPMNWLLQRDTQEISKQVTAQQKDGSYLVGITLAWKNRPVNIGEGLKGAWDNMLLAGKQILLGFKMLVTGQFKMDDLGGPVRIVEVTGQVAQLGIGPMLAWSGMFSLYLGIFNLLPFPALDGSRLVFLGFEALRGKPVDPSRESMVHFIGFALLMLVMIAVTYNDILRLIQG
jgi:regulator of sigma E protease